ncbi:outer membrane protein assembly factor BamB [Simiduia aestuariiviva]|uniref:Outer membrane protein assembly factor BamB n=1 Tax=Simiduia aestuariiviva TaxID=1510459 RepID=A0A839UK81_9GAMM|nr:outer membrane protein assembly factor BamB [Simiduia aestuariiviva]
MSEKVEVQRLDMNDCYYVLFRPSQSSSELMNFSDIWVHKYSKEGKLLWRSGVSDRVRWQDSSNVFVGLTRAKDGSVLATTFSGEVYFIDEDTGIASYFKTVR